MASTPLSQTFPASRLSPLSPDNPVSTQLMSDPAETRSLLQDINRALRSPVPSPADYVRKLEADLTGTPGSSARLGGSSQNTSADQTAKELVASLERMLQQPAATPGRAALSALRHSQAAEVGAGPGGSVRSGTGLDSAPSFSLRSSLTSRTVSTAADAGGASPVVAAAVAALPSRWRMAADRAASFRSTGSAAGRSPHSASWRGETGAAAARSAASHAADLLAEIDRVVSPYASPSASPAASPSFAHLAGPAASPPGSPQLYSTTPWMASQQQQQQQQQTLSPPPPQQASPASTPVASPRAEGAAESRWNAVASSQRAGLLSSSGAPASPLAAFGFAAGSPRLPSAPGSPQGGYASAVPSPAAGHVGAAKWRAPGMAAAAAIPSMERVELPTPEISFASAACVVSFDAEARQVLAELAQFADLERSTAAEFTAAVAAGMERLFALPAAA